MVPWDLPFMFLFCDFVIVVIFVILTHTDTKTKTHIPNYRPNTPRGQVSVVVKFNRIIASRLMTWYKLKWAPLQPCFGLILGWVEQISAGKLSQGFGNKRLAVVVELIAAFKAGRKVICTIFLWLIPTLDKRKTKLIRLWKPHTAVVLSTLYFFSYLVLKVV